VLSDVVKGGAARAMVDGRLRSGVNSGALLATFARSKLSIKLVHVSDIEGRSAALVSHGVVGMKWLGIAFFASKPRGSEIAADRDRYQSEADMVSGVVRSLSRPRKNLLA
jgi:hypothetical protein